MTMITPSYLGENIEYSSLHDCRSTLEDPTYGSYCLHAAGQTQGAENTVFSFAYPGKKAMSREIFPGKFYASGKSSTIAPSLPLKIRKIVSCRLKAR